MEVDPIVPEDLARRHLFERLELLAWIESKNADLVHGPAFVLPTRCHAPTVVTIHDLVFRLYPRTVPISRRYYYRTAIPRSIQMASRILADSESTAHGLTEHMKVDPGRISVVPLGVNERFFHAAESQQTYWTRTHYGLPERYLLTVGTLEPRKNLPRLLEAYALLTARRAHVPDLVVVGREGWGITGLRRSVARLGLRKRVHFIGFVEDEDLPVLYREAAAFVCVSLYEGFGLPVLEAMAAGAPVVASNTSSLPEVTGECAVRVDPLNPEAIARGMEEALDFSPEHTRRRVESARARARKFSWESTARQTLAVYESLASRSS